jgi:hypothetical protein
MTETMKPHDEYFTAARPFDATKDDCLLDGMEQALSLCAKNEMALMFTIGAVRRDDGWRIEVWAPGEEGHGEGRNVREALANLFDEAEQMEADHD